MALEEVNTVYIPLIGEYEIDSAGALAVLVVGLIGGSTLMNMTEPIGANFGSMLNSFIGQFLPGGNPANSGADGV